MREVVIVAICGSVAVLEVWEAMVVCLHRFFL